MTFKRISYHTFHGKCKDSHFNKDEFAWDYTWPVGDYTINKYLVLHNSSWSIFLTWTASKVFPTWQDISHGFHFEDEGQSQTVENGIGTWAGEISTLAFGSGISGFSCCFYSVFSGFILRIYTAERAVKKNSDLSLDWASLGRTRGSNMDFLHWDKRKNWVLTDQPGSA